MFKFFEFIANFVTTIVNFVVGLFQMLLGLVQLVFKAQVFLFEVVQNLPPFLVAAALGFLALAILFQILNKGS